MIDTQGHVIHIDFGFAFGMASGHEWSFERAHFKLTKDYIDVMGGTTSECFNEFKKLFVDGLKAARSNPLTALGLVEIMMYKSNYPCFTGTRCGGGVTLKRFEKRLMSDVPDIKVGKKALQLIINSIDSRGRSYMMSSRIIPMDWPFESVPRVSLCLFFWNELITVGRCQPPACDV